jgi:hypothetical protein
VWVRVVDGVRVNVPKLTAISTYRLKASLDLLNDRSSNYVAVNAVQYAMAEHCSTISKAGQRICSLVHPGTTMY